jgi:2,3-bisphosphoglycerate-dependent phosphoglycerate mutase
MSDLFCAATLLVCRHGDAAYERDAVLSDEGGRLSERGAQQVRELAESVRGRKVARVYTSSLARAAESGALAAEVLGVDAVQLDGLQEFSVGALAGRPHDDPELVAVYEAWLRGDLATFIPGGESGADVVERFREALQGISDLHRGETVLVFTHGGVMSFVLPLVCGGVHHEPTKAKFLPNCAVAEVSVDGDGFELLSWPGSADRTVV